MSEQKSPFPAGFERDAKTLLLAFDMKALSLAALQHNLKRLGVEFPEEPRVMAAPTLQRPTLHDEEPEGEFYPIDGDPDHVVDIHTNAVFNIHTGAHVGFFEPAEPDLEFEVSDEDQLVLEAGDEPLGPPPDDAEFDDPEFDLEADPDIVPRPNPRDDEQVTTEVPE